MNARSATAGESAEQPAPHQPPSPAPRAWSDRRGRRRTCAPRRGSGSSSSPATRSPALDTSERTAARSSAWTCPIAADDARLPARRPDSVALERHLHDQRAARPRRLAQQRQRLRHVLEHVRQHAQVERAVGHRQRARRRTLDRAPTRGIAPRRARARPPPPRCRTPPATRRTRAATAPRAARRRRSRSRRPTRRPAPAGAHSRTTWSALPRAPSSRHAACRSPPRA